MQDTEDEEMTERFNFRLSKDIRLKIDTLTEAGRFKSSSDFLRYLIDKEWDSFILATKGDEQKEQSLKELLEAQMIVYGLFKRKGGSSEDN